MSEKITPMQLRERYHLNIHELALSSGIAEAIVYNFIMRVPITREEAVTILSAISNASGERYDLTNVDVVIHQ